MNIKAVVVTYNRLNYLKECIDSLRIQTYKLDEIVVVNNSSSDGTLDWLSTQKDLTIITQENSGGAGGFHTGIKYCYENGADWIWCMDDDIEMVNYALEELLKYTNFSLCIHPARIYYDNIPLQWEGVLDVSTGRIIQFHDKSFNNKEYSFVNYACFEGMFIHSSIVEKIGFPEIKYFIIKDDLIYGLKAAIYTNVIYLHKYLVVKKKKDIILATKLRYHFWKESNVKLFYNIRNSWLVFDELKKLNYLNNFFSLSIFIIKLIITLFHVIISDKSLKRIIICFDACIKGIRYYLQKGDLQGFNVKER